MRSSEEWEALAVELLAALDGVLPYAESRAEDLAEAEPDGGDDLSQAHPNTQKAWAALNTAEAVKAKFHAAVGGA